MKDPKISVIIPVYNVEPYLRKCLDSVINQTYQNLEIILVDDGSPDACGAICDEYAARDGRIHVIHKENGGVSSARNAGLAMAGGEWIGWVDSDDWVEPDMYEYMLKHALSSGAEIAVCSRCEIYKDKRVTRGWEEVALLNTEQALEQLLKNDAMQNYLCDKLWKRSLFDGIVFPEGRTFEDMAVEHRMFERAQRVICLPEWKYNYFQRAGSIVDDISLGNRVNHFAAAKERLEEMRDRWPQLLHLLEAQCVASSITAWCSYYANPKVEREKARPLLLEMSAFAREYGQSALRHSKLGIVGRSVLRLIPYPTWWSFALARLLGKIYKLKHGREL